MTYEAGDRVWCTEPGDEGAGTVTSVSGTEFGTPIVFVEWDDGTPECGLPDDMLRLLEEK